MTVKDYCIKFKKERLEQGQEVDICLLNITYYILTRLYDGSIDDVKDVAAVYDNLEINNQIITRDNINEYDSKYLMLRIHHSIDTIKKWIIQCGFIYLLDYYLPNGTGPIECALRFDPDLNQYGF